MAPRPQCVLGLALGVLACVVALPAAHRKAQRGSTAVRQRVDLTEAWPVVAVSFPSGNRVVAVAAADRTRGGDSGLLQVTCDPSSPEPGCTHLEQCDYAGSDPGGRVALARDASTVAYGHSQIGAFDLGPRGCVWCKPPVTHWWTAIGVAPGLVVGARLQDVTTLFDSGSGAQKRQLAPANSSVYAFGFSPDARLLVGGLRAGRLLVWNVVSGQAVRRMQAGFGPVWAVAFSPDAQTIASGGVDRVVRLWQTGDGEPRELRGHVSSVASLAFAPDGSLLASGGDDGLVRLWELPSGAPAAVLRGHSAGVLAVAFSPDGSLLASGADDGCLIVWNVPAH